MIGLGFIGYGVVLLTVAGYLSVGPVGLLIAGAVSVLVGLVVPWEEVTRGQRPRTSPRRVRR